MSAKGSCAGCKFWHAGTVSEPGKGACGYYPGYRVDRGKGRFIALLVTEPAFSCAQFTSRRVR